MVEAHELRRALLCDFNIGSRGFVGEESRRAVQGEDAEDAAQPLVLLLRVLHPVLYFARGKHLVADALHRDFREETDDAAGSQGRSGANAEGYAKLTENP